MTICWEGWGGKAAIMNGEKANKKEIKLKSAWED
jgi:hypothetical protein